MLRARTLLCAALLLGSAAPARAEVPRAAGGVGLIEVIEKGAACAVGRTRDVAQLDAKGYAAWLDVEQALASGLAPEAAVRIAWEELASARAARFVERERVLVCLTALPGSTLWQKRFPDAKARQQVFAVANAGGAFLREPRPGSVSELEHFAKLPPPLRAGATGASRLLALAANAELPLAEDAVERLRVRATLAEQLDAELAPRLIDALLRTDASEALQHAVLRLIAERRPPALRAPLEKLAVREPAPPALVFEALARLDGALSPERTAQLLRDASAERRATAARFASGPGAAGLLAERLRTDPSPEVRAAAVERLVALEGERALSPALATLADHDGEVRLAGARAISSLGAAAVPDLRAAVDANRQPAAGSAIAALRMTKTEEAYRALVEIAASHPDEGMRQLAGFAIGEPLGERHAH